MPTKTPRTCDKCARHVAKWYCAADDAFLCGVCDAAVHVAGPSAAEAHHRLRLRGSRGFVEDLSDVKDSGPAWLRVFTRKARTPRGGPHGKSSVTVPEMETSSEEEENSNDGEEKFMYRVPVLEESVVTEDNVKVKKAETDSDCFIGFLPSEMELEEFNADIDSLLTGEIDNSSFSMEELDSLEEDDEHFVKEEYSIMDDNLVHNKEEVEEEKESKKNVGLRLNYEAVIKEWTVDGVSTSPWMDGERPELGPDDCWLHCMGMWGGEKAQGATPAEIGGGHVDEGRVARVSRYREKRRTRLFSKKIRYEVRKLNAEKRPRMKGRFVKRANFVI